MEKNLLMAAVFGEDVQYYPYLWWRREEVEGVAEETKTMFEGTASYSVAKVSVDSAIQEALESLDAEERDMLNLCFGLKDGKRKGYKEISKEFAMSRRQVGKVINRAIRKLCLPSKSHCLREFLIPTPEQRFKEKQELINLEEELRKATAGEELAQRKDEDALRVAINTATANYREKHGNTPLCGRVRLTLKRSSITRLSQLKVLSENDLTDLRNVGKKSLDFIREILRVAEQNEASP